MRKLFFHRLTRRLFFKIFLAFWLSMTVAGIILLGVEGTRNAQLAQRWRGVTGDAFAVYATSVAQDYTWEDNDPKTRSLRQFLADLEARTTIRAWVFDESGREISGYVAAQRLKNPLWLRDRMSQLVGRARESGHTEFADLEGITLAARAAKTSSGQLWVLAGTLQDARYDFWGASSRVQFLRLLAILAAAGAVSWLLARHLTHPLDNLRAMTQRLATGDFTARADARLDRRRDELAELAGDFNSMAARIERLLREQERLLASQRHLLADIAHELRSPLARSTVALELARDALEPESLESEAQEIQHNNNSVVGSPPPLELDHLTPVREALNRIERETGNLTDLIDRLLVISRLESGVQKPELAPVGLAALLRAIVADADFEASSRQRCVCLTASEPCVVMGTSPLLRSAIENVVRNALRHTPENTTVEVALFCTEPHLQNWQQVGYFEGCYTSDLRMQDQSLEPAREPQLDVVPSAVISVCDAGTGVPQQELSEIFRPFYRAGCGRARESGGAGLGLTITARAIELHGGQFRLCNIEDGGLQVQLRLPLLAEDAPRRQKGQA